MFHANGHHPRCPNPSRSKDGVSARVDSRVAYASALGLDMFDVADANDMDFMRTSSTLESDPDIIDTRTQAAQDYHHHTLLSPVQGIPPALKPISGDDDDSDDDGDGDDEDNDDEDDDSRGNGDGCGHGGETSGNNVGLFTAASSAQSAAGAVKDGPIQHGLSSEHVSAAGIAPNADEDGTPALTDSDSYSQSNQPKLDWEIPLPPSSGDHGTHTHRHACCLYLGRSTNGTIDCGTST